MFLSSLRRACTARRPHTHRRSSQPGSLRAGRHRHLPCRLQPRQRCLQRSRRVSRRDRSSSEESHRRSRARRHQLVRQCRRPHSRARQRRAMPAGHSKRLRHRHPAWTTWRLSFRTRRLWRYRCLETSQARQLNRQRRRSIFGRHRPLKWQLPTRTRTLTSHLPMRRRHRPLPVAEVAAAPPARRTASNGR